MANIRKRYNQVPHLTQHTTWERNKTKTNTHHQQELRGQPFQAGDHKATMNRSENMRNTGHKNTLIHEEEPPVNG